MEILLPKLNTALLRHHIKTAAKYKQQYLNRRKNKKMKEGSGDSPSDTSPPKKKMKAGSAASPADTSTSSRDKESEVSLPSSSSPLSGK